MDRAIIPVFGIKTEKLEMRRARSDPRIQKDSRDMKFPLELTFNSPNPEVVMEGLEVGDEDYRVRMAFQGHKDRFESLLQCPSGQGVGERAIRLVPRQRGVAIGGEPDLP